MVALTYNPKRGQECWLKTPSAEKTALREVSPVVGREFGRVEFLVEKSPAVVSDAVETVGNALHETVLIHLRQAVAGVVGDGHTQVFESLRGHVPLVSHHFQDVLVHRAHPLGSLSGHARSIHCGTHSIVGNVMCAVHQCKSVPTLTTSAVRVTANY